MNKRLLTLWVLLLVGILIAACGGGGSTTPEPTAAPEMTEAATAVEEATTEPVATEPAGEASGDVIQLQLMGWASSDAENTRLQEMIDNFNSANSDVQAQLLLVPDYDTKLQTSLAGGAPPDVFYIDSFKLPDFVAANAIAPIGDELENVDDFYPNLRDAFTLDGTLYCPPKDFSTLALEYNKDMFDAAGLDYPTADWTWDDLRNAAEALTDSDNGVYGMVLSADMARWIAFLYQAGGTVTNADSTSMTLDSPEAKEAMDFYVGLVQDGYAAQPADLDSGWPGEAFGKQKAAMAMEGNWIIPFLQDQFPDVNFDVVELPAGPGGKATMSFTVCYGVPANAAHHDASVRLVNFLTGSEGMKAWTDLGLAMPTRASLRDTWLEKFPNLEPFLNGAEYSHPWQFQPGFQDVLDTVNSGLQEAFTGLTTTDQVLQNAQEVGTEVLNR
ncbi:MAG: ABC transporter substrate-binding protein [Ardenticatenaceae bacterium]|nr:ABC transporter substrate-binding protein [Ardenticatenaceae bacterium]